MQSLFFPRAAWLMAAASIGLVLNCLGSATGQVTQVYSFETDLDGFVPNPPGGAITLSQETSGLGATSGTNSMKVVHAQLNGFAGATTPVVPPAFFDPLGLDFVRFDLTNTNRFAPPPTDPPTPGVPTFADISVTFFGTLPGNPVPEAGIQYFFSQVSVGSLEPGTHEIEIDLRNDGGLLGTGGGLNTATGDIKGYDDWTAAGFVPLEFQIYINKSLSVTNPAFAWTVYIDNVRVGRDVEGLPGDFNEDGTVDAADYVTWRKNDGTTNPLANDGGLGVPIGPQHYDLWRANFSAGGGGSVSAVAAPEPGAMIIMLLGVASLICRRGAFSVRR